MVMAMAAVVPASAADYPTKPIKIMVPFNPGGSSDGAARAMLPYLKKQLGVDVVIVNINGAGGAVGWSRLRGENKDGYNIGLYTTSMPTLEAMKSANFTYKDFEPIAGVGASYLAVAVKGSSSYDSLKDYIDAAKKKPGSVSLAMGRGSPAQFAAVMLANAADAKLNLVNVGAGAEKKAAVIGGHVDAMIEPLSSVIGQEGPDGLKVLSVLAPKRLKSAPNIPTAKEAGYNVVYGNLVGLIGPKGMPQDAVAKLAKAIKAVTENADFQKAAANFSLEVEYQGTDQFADTMEKVNDDNVKVGKQIGF